MSFARANAWTGILILARGGLHIRLDDYWGRSSIISRIGPGEMFGEAYAAPGQRAAEQRRGGGGGQHGAVL